MIFQLGPNLFPQSFALDRGRLNLWWAVHFAISWQLFRPRSSTWIFCVVITWMEIALRTARAAIFLINPDWGFLPSAWFAQQGAALLLFLAFALHLHASAAGKALRDLS